MTLNWRKSTRCETAACVEIAYQRPARCEHSACVEIAYRQACEAGNCVKAGRSTNGTWHIRDSKTPDGPVLTFDSDEWAAFVAAIKNGQYDQP